MGSLGQRATTSQRNGMAKETYYIVEVILKEVKSYDGSILTKENSVGYLGESSGYGTVQTSKEWATKFETIPDTKKVSQYDGMPWYCRIKSHKVIKVEEEFIHNRKETYV
jgi:hypothetical protein